MSLESSEVQVARFDERFQMLVERFGTWETKQEEQHQSIERLSRSIEKVDSRIANVEEQVAAAHPTIQEFISIKQKVVGAGTIGKWLWYSGVFLLGLVATFREAIFNWFAKG